MASTPLEITVTPITVPRTLSAFIPNLTGLPNDPASLYLSISHGSLVIYIAPLSTIITIDLLDLSNALNQQHDSAIALKSLLEDKKTVKVFFDARTPAKILFEKCDITLSVDVCDPNHDHRKSADFHYQSVLEKSPIHELQMMELALRESDPNRQWLVGLDKCIAKNSRLDLQNLMLDGPDYGVNLDHRILHLPSLWKNYQEQLGTRVCGVFTKSFWIAEVRQATKKRLEVSRGRHHAGHDVNSARSGWCKEYIEEQTEIWNEDVMMDSHHNGEWLGGEEHWRQFEAL